MNTKAKIGLISVLRREIRLMNSIPLLWISFFVISLVPSIYALTYLGSIWDPYGRLSNLPVVLVNLDSGTQFRGEQHNLGRLLFDELERRQAFGFEEYSDRQAAESAVKSGDAYFALVVPEDFSRKALPGIETVEVELITSSGTSYTASLIGQKFTEMAVENLNHRLEVKRWEVVLASGKTALDAVRQLEEGSGQALQGATNLYDGIQQLGVGAAELHSGQADLSAGLSAIDTGRLVSAGQAVHGGAEKLANGLSEHRIIDKMAGIDPVQLTQLAEGATLYQQKIEELAAGLEKAAQGAAQLKEGSARLKSGIGQTHEGSNTLREGLERLNAGLGQFAAAFPDSQQDAGSMAVSVTSRHTPLNEARSNGLGFSPFLIGFSLWIGAMSASFVFLLTTFSKSLKGTGAVARVFGKELLPAAMCILGVVILGALIQWKSTGIQNVAGYYTLLVLAGLTYNSITLLLIRAIGDSGKLVALLLLVIQLASASGAYPIELSAPFYQAISPFLPMTAVVDGLRATMFGSFGADWMQFGFRLLPWLLGCWMLDLLVIRRSEYIADRDYGPALRLAFGNRD